MATTSTQTADTRLRPAPTPMTAGPFRDQVAACIRRHLAGDREAMADLTRLVTPWLHHVIRPYRMHRDMADDVVQSTLLVALTHLHGLRDPTSGLSWLSIIARREALRVVRTERRYVTTDDLPSLHLAAAAGDGPEEIVLAAHTRAVVRRTVSKLPHRHRVLIERIIGSDEPSYATISADLQIPLGSIGPTRKRGLEQMRRLLAADPEWDTDVSA